MSHISDLQSAVSWSKIPYNAPLSPLISLCIWGFSCPLVSSTSSEDVSSLAASVMRRWDDRICGDASVSLDLVRGQPVNTPLMSCQSNWHRGRRRVTVMGGGGGWGQRSVFFASEFSSGRRFSEHDVHQSRYSNTHVEVRVRTKDSIHVAWCALWCIFIILRSDFIFTFFSSSINWLFLFPFLFYSCLSFAHSFFFFCFGLHLIFLLLFLSSSALSPNLDIHMA